MEHKNKLFSPDASVRSEMDVAVTAEAYKAAEKVFMSRYANKDEKNLTSDCGDGAFSTLRAEKTSLCH